MPATPPVGSGLRMLVPSTALCVWMASTGLPAAWIASRRVPIGTSVLVQIMLLCQRASKRDRAASTSVAVRAGSRASTRTESEPAIPRPKKVTRLSLGRPGDCGLTTPAVPCSRARATASARPR
jgi:hypothetical protein